MLEQLLNARLMKPFKCHVDQLEFITPKHITIGIKNFVYSNYSYQAQKNLLIIKSSYGTYKLTKMKSMTESRMSVCHFENLAN